MISCIKIVQQRQHRRTILPRSFEGFLFDRRDLAFIAIFESRLAVDSSLADLFIFVAFHLFSKCSYTLFLCFIFVLDFTGFACTVFFLDFDLFLNLL
ncbi:MAG: hypothetical protein H6Q70_4195 [Firmicutes bacterium]|nr:hypothetical protein [Bacillota bacterium]